MEPPLTCTRTYCSDGHTQECLSLAEQWWAAIYARHERLREDQRRRRMAALESEADKFYRGAR